MLVPMPRRLQAWVARRIALRHFALDALSRAISKAVNGHHTLSNKNPAEAHAKVRHASTASSPRTSSTRRSQRWTRS